MTGPQQYTPVPDDTKPVSGEGLSFVDRYSVHPLLFALGSLVSIFILYQVGGGIITFFVMGGTEITRENVAVIRWMTVGAQLIFILVPTLILARLFSSRLNEIFRFRVPGLRESLFALIALFSLQRVFEVYMFFQELVPLPDIVRKLLDPFKKVLEELTKALIQADSPVELVFVIFVIAVVPSIVEELLFRGFIQKVFERLMSPLVAAILAGTIFGLYHVNPIQIVPLIGLGVFFGLLRYRSQSLLLPISAHFVNNLMAVFASFYGLNEENLLNRPESETSIEMMAFELAAFAILFSLAFVAYLRITHNISRNIYKEVQ